MNTYNLIDGNNESIRSYRVGRQKAATRFCSPTLTNNTDTIEFVYDYIYKNDESVITCHN